MNSKLIVFLALLGMAFSADDQPAPAAAAAAPAAADAPAASKSTSGCQMIIGSGPGREIAKGSQVCWRHPEYLTCLGGGNWKPAFCPNGQKCEESGGRASCVTDPFADDGSKAQNSEPAPAAAAAPQNSEPAPAAAAAAPQNTPAETAPAAAAPGASEERK